MKTKVISTFLLVLFISTVVCSKTGQNSGKANLSNEKGKYSYAIGYNVGSGMARDNLDLDMDSFIAAVEDALNGVDSKLSPEEAQTVMQNLMASLQKKRQDLAAENKKKGEEFLSQNKKKEGVITTPSGLQYKIISKGDSEIKPKSSDTIKVHYAGKFIDGKEFDSSHKRKEPTQFKADQVIRGWTEGLQLMTVGSKYEFFIPSDLGYGPNGNQAIPGNSVLIFEVELLEIVK
ncbi:MAG: FKBP-type peptidyl-prolyl cis-trans isomerase [Leptospirales bacterium]|nr:FKBP-type peptidyl-prolyl cis-trans isomerase [Leptospirales bacterium]